MTGTDRAELAWTASQTVAQAASLWDVEPGYLNTSSYGPPPRPAWDALLRSLDDWRAGRTSWEPWADAVAVARHWFAALVGVDPATVATGAAVSQLLAPVAAAVPDGTRVLVPDVEFTSNIFPWAVHADRGVHRPREDVGGELHVRDQHACAVRHRGGHRGQQLGDGGTGRDRRWVDADQRREPMPGHRHCVGPRFPTCPAGPPVVQRPQQCIPCRARGRAVGRGVEVTRLAVPQRGRLCDGL